MKNKRTDRYNDYDKKQREKEKAIDLRKKRKRKDDERNPKDKFIKHR